MSSQPKVLSLESIYESLVSPDSSTAETIRIQFSKATVNVWHRSFQCWYHYLDTQRWPTAKLLRCLDTMICNIPSTQRHAVFESKPFQHCLKLLLNLPEDAVVLLPQVKCLSHLLQQKTESIEQRVSRHHSIQASLVHWACAEESTASIRYYCLNALNHLALKADAGPKLARLMCRLLETEEAVLVARVLGRLSGLAIDDDMLSLWQRSITYYTQSAETESGLKRAAGMLYSVTHILGQATRSSENRKALAEAHWKPFELLVLLSRRWWLSLVEKQKFWPEEERALIKTWRLVSAEADMLPQVPVYGAFTMAVIDLLNSVFVAFISQGVLAEPNGFQQWSSYQICIELDTRELVVSAETVKEHEKLLSLLLDVYIQYVQIPSCIDSADVVAWCLKSFLILLHGHDDSPLVPKLKKLVVYFLHIEKAVDVLVGAPKLILDSVWQPTLEHVRAGLKLVAELSEEELGSFDVKRSKTMYKAGRALVSLGLVTQNPRGRERLVEADILSLMHLLLEDFRWPPPLLAFYGNFMWVIARLTGWSAFIRVRLRELFPKIKTLLKTAAGHPYDSGCNKLINGCLLLIVSFQYDTSSMEQWLSEESVLPVLLELAFPWPSESTVLERRKCYQQNREIMTIAASTLNYFLGYTSGARQMTERPQALTSLCQAELDCIEFDGYGLSVHSCAYLLLSNAPILSNAFHLFFQSAIQRPRGISKSLFLLSKDLHKNKLEEYLKVYRFAHTHDDSALKLHEMAAVAIGYSSLNSAPVGDWLVTLCQMLVYPVDSAAEDNIRRSIAAQVIEILCLDFTWPLPEPKPVVWQRTESSERAGFVTDDGQRVEGDRRLLKESSPIFDALLSKDYIESEMDWIPLGDVTFHSLDEFIALLGRINTNQPALPQDYAWPSLVSVWKVADRFCCEVAKNVCENWILEQVQQIETKTPQERNRCLEGLMALYRDCHDPMAADGGLQSPAWPFADMLNLSLKVLLQHLTETCKTHAFLGLAHDRKIEELEALCSSITILLSR